MEATDLQRGWIYDYTAAACRADRRWLTWLMLRAIAAAKKKNDQIDASKIADCLRLRFSA